MVLTSICNVGKITAKRRVIFFDGIIFVLTLSYGVGDTSSDITFQSNNAEDFDDIIKPNSFVQIERGESQSK